MERVLCSFLLLAFCSAANALEQVKIFTQSQPWAIPADVRVIYVTLCGGGNGGAGGYDNYAGIGGGGGGGGASSTIHDRPIFIGENGPGTLVILVGAGGEGGAVGQPGKPGTSSQVQGSAIANFIGIAQGQHQPDKQAQPGTAMAGGKGGDGSTVGGPVFPIGGDGATSMRHAVAGQNDLHLSWYQTAGAAGGGGGFGTRGGAAGGNSESSSVPPKNAYGSSGGSGGASAMARGGVGGDGAPGARPQNFGSYCAGGGGGAGSTGMSRAMPGGKGGDGIVILRWQQ